jgi:hypothetical protein
MLLQQVHGVGTHTALTMCADGGRPVSISAAVGMRVPTLDCDPGGENPATAGCSYGLLRKAMRT